MIDTSFSVFLTLIALIVLFAIRIEVVWGSESRAFSKILKNMDDSEARGEEPTFSFDLISEHGLGHRLLDLRKWTFKQFYPGLADK